MIAPVGILSLSRVIFGLPASFPLGSSFALGASAFFSVAEARGGAQTRARQLNAAASIKRARTIHLLLSTGTGGRPERLFYHKDDSDPPQRTIGPTSPAA